MVGVLGSALRSCWLIPRWLSVDAWSGDRTRRVPRYHVGVMTESSTEPREPAAADGDPAREPFPRWKLFLCLAAGVMVLLGAVLGLIDGDSATAPMQARSGGEVPPGAAASLIGQSGSAEAGAAGVGTEESGNSWSPGLLKMGFSFFVGFAMGLLLRMFMRITFVVAGAVALVLVGLSYVEFITVNWGAMETSFTGFVDRISGDFDHFRTVLTGSLPQAGLGGLGLLAGFKKR